MIAEMAELDSFIGKFKQLWKNGHSVHLDIDANAGNAWVGIRLQLNDGVRSNVNPSHVEKTGNARQRRRQRREQLRRNSFCCIRKSVH